MPPSEVSSPRHAAEDAQLGSLTLRRALGQGGMGEVWEAWHPASGARLAVKILRAEGPWAQAAQRAFAREVRAVARLDHPHIVRIHHHGLVDAAASQQTAGRLREGSPYLVMELAAAGTLAAWRARLAWPELREALSALLDALAHAHARGVLHLDLKPDNVLLVPRAGRLAIKLADFGLARVMGETSELHAGTPAYMAPEQLRRGRLGPWTDLYALGCLAWALACGQPPFEGKVEELVRQQLSMEPPPFHAAVPLPEGFEAWLRRLLDKSPARRFQRAADAAWALGRLGQLPEAAPQGRGAEPLDEDATLALEGSWMELPLAQEATGDAQGAPAASDELPPVPQTWRRPEVWAAPRALEGMGADTFGLREAPFVGREAARDRLWQALRGDGVLWLRLRGEDRRALARWLCLRAEACGAAWTLELDGSPLRDQLTRRQGWDRLSPEALRQALRQDLGQRSPLPAETAERIARWLTEDTVQEDPWALVAALLGRLAAGRALVLVVSEADAAGLRLARSALDGPGCRLALALEAPGAGEEPAPPCPTETLNLEPCAHEDLLQLIDRTLRLEPTLAERLAQRSAGSPSYLLEVLSGWIARGELALGEHGFVLREGAWAALPQSLKGARRARLEEALGSAPEEAGLALERAAVLGQELDAAELSAAAAGLGDLAALTERLLRRGLWRATEQGFAFADVGLRELVIEDAARSGRLAAHHLACARALEALSPEPGRLGRHLLGAGRPEEALEPLQRAVERSHARQEHARTLGLVAEARSALERAGVGVEDPRWGWLGLRRNIALESLGQLREALAEAEALLFRAHDHGPLDLEIEAARRLARLLRVVGRPEDAEPLLRELLERLHPEDAQRRAAALHALAFAVQQQGRIQECVPLAKQALALGPADLVIRSELSYLLGVLHTLWGDPVAARPDLERALEDARQSGVLDVISQAVNSLADLDRREGALERAEAGYREAARLGELRGGGSEVFPRMNLALLDIDRARWAPAREALLYALAFMEQRGRATWVGICHLALLAPVAGLGDLPALRRHLDAAERALAANAGAEADALHCSRVALAQARVQGFEQECPRIEALIAAQERHLQRNLAQAERAAL
ncbi:MAG: serine/threonine protein kinase [Alphaproteobacteria bacterium]|nr:serine/threonine protein kinase [Alphaproteobacteria bacterium]